MRSSVVCGLSLTRLPSGKILNPSIYLSKKVVLCEPISAMAKIRAVTLQQAWRISLGLK